MTPEQRPATRPVFAALALAALLATAPPPAGNALARQPDRPGAFDYYLLSLSWSPEYCAGSREPGDTGQCGAGRRYGFVLHGLWPQYAGGGWPGSCAPATPVPAGIVTAMLPITPSPALIAHEWEKHGTCSGLTVDGYFAAAARAFRSLTIPPPYRRPDAPLVTSPAKLAADFAAANPGLTADEVSVLCRKQYLAEIRLCLGKDLKPARCGAGVGNQCGDTVALRPAR